MARDKDNAFFDYKAPIPTVDASDAAEKARTAAMSKANAASRPATFLEQVENQIAKTQARISTLENTQADLDASLNTFPKAGTFLRWDYQNNTQTTGTLRRAVIADGKGGEKIDFSSTEKNPDYVSGSRGGGNTGGNNNNGNNNNNNTNNNTNNNVSNNITLVSTETDEYGNVIGIYSDGTTKILIPSGNKYKSTVDEDAYSILENTFKDFGLEELVPEIKKFMEAGLGSNQAAVELRKTTAYITRFKGNETRRASGLNVLSEAEYLALEDSYSQTLRAYGLQNYFGIDRKIKTSSMADIIGNDISAVEFKDRIDTVVTRVNNADPAIKNTLNAFYNITDTDLVKYFLNPKENLPKLQEKVTSAEIGAAALGQGLITDVARATALAQLGVTKEKAQEGYQAIGGVLPTTTKLGQIYDEEGINYTQGTAEEEVFKQLESAKRKRLRLAEKEVGSFSGTSGLARGALGSGKSSAF